MPRDTKPDQVVKQKPGAAAAPDVDAEHDPAVSRQASRAGLRREAEAQHAKAGDVSHDAVEEALLLTAVRIDQSARNVDALITGNSERGPDADAIFCRAILGDVLDNLRRVNKDARLQLDGAVALKPAIRRVNAAFDRFEAAWQRAETRFTASRVGDGLSDGPRAELVALNQAFGLNREDKTSRDDSKAARSDDAILRQALQSNLAAAQLAARSVRMGLTTGGSHVTKDLEKMVHHVNEIGATLRSDVTSRNDAKAYDHALLHQTLTEIHAVQQEIAVNPALAKDLAANSTFRFSLVTLENRIGGKWMTASAGQVQDIKGRIMGKEVRGTSVRLTIGCGTNQGVTERTTGHLVDAAGKHGPRFEVAEVTGDVCYGSLETVLDYILQYPMVLLHPGTP